MRIASNLNPRTKGDLGEMAAAHWLAFQGARVWIPLMHSPDVDLIAEVEHELIRVQVKTSTQRRRGRYPVTVCTRGGNQSWKGVTERLDPARFDYMFVLVGDGRRWFIPSSAIQAACGLTLGGDRYGAFEVDDQPGFLTATIPGAETGSRGDS